MLRAQKSASEEQDFINFQKNISRSLSLGRKLFVDDGIQEPALGTELLLSLETVFGQYLSKHFKSLMMFTIDSILWNSG